MIASLGNSIQFDEHMMKKWKWTCWCHKKLLKWHCYIVTSNYYVKWNYRSVNVFIHCVNIYVNIDQVLHLAPFQSPCVTDRSQSCQMVLRVTLLHFITLKTIWQTHHYLGSRSVTQDHRENCMKSMCTSFREECIMVILKSANASLLMWQCRWHFSGFHAILIC